MPIYEVKSYFSGRLVTLVDAQSEEQALERSANISLEEAINRMPNPGRGVTLPEGVRSTNVYYDFDDEEVNNMDEKPDALAEFQNSISDDIEF